MPDNHEQQPDEEQRADRPQPDTTDASRSADGAERVAAANTAERPPETGDDAASGASTASVDESAESTTRITVSGDLGGTSGDAADVAAGESVGASADSVEDGSTGHPPEDGGSSDTSAGTGDAERTTGGEPDSATGTTDTAVTAAVADASWPEEDPEEDTARTEFPASEQATDTGTARAQETGTQESGTEEAGTQETGTQETGTQEAGTQETGATLPSTVERTTDQLPVEQLPAGQAPAGQAPAGQAPESDTERTEQLTALPSDFPNLGETTQSLPAVGAAAEETGRSLGTSGAGWAGAANASEQVPPEERTSTGPPVPPPSSGGGAAAGGGRGRGWWRGGIIAGVVVAVLALLYVGDVAFSSGTVPRGTVVADVSIGGMNPAAAERKLRSKLGPGLHGPVTVRAGDNTTQLDPDASGLRMDWKSTVAEAGSQPLNPFVRVSSLFTIREVDPVSTGDREQVASAIEDAKPRLDREAREGTIQFDGAEPVVVEPETGQDVDVDRATDVVVSEWAESGPVDVPFDEQPVRTTSKGVHATAREVAAGPVSAPVRIDGDGQQATFEPAAIADSLRFEPGDNGKLNWHVDVPAAAETLDPQLADTVHEPKDADITLEGNKPKVHPSKDGRGIDWEKSFQHLSAVLDEKQPQQRTVHAEYKKVPPEFSTEQAKGLGVREVVGEFETGDFDDASGKNIRRVAEQVNGAIVKPGETFSLNGHTGPRGKAQGYVESGVIEDGRPQKSVGGGISQFATTLFNATYFAGMENVEHKEHSYYISRYPAGRESTVFQAPDGSSVIDVKFKNVSDSGIMITTDWTPDSISVKLWGTKQFDVQSDTSEHKNPVPPQHKKVPAGEACSPSSGTPGFTVFNTRTIKDLKNNESHKEKEKTVYEPQPIIECDGD